MRKISIVLLLIAFVAVLSACGKSGDKNAPDNANGGNADTAQEEQGGDTGGQPSDSGDAGQNDQPGTGITEPDSAGQSPAETIGIELELEGMRETRTGTLAVSENGYYMYTLPLFVFTPEEPLMDQVYMETFPNYFMRIQSLGPEANIDELKAAAEEELRDLGDVVELRDDQIYNPFIREHAVFHLHAIKMGEVTKTIMLIEIDGHLFRIMLHMPHGEASEGAGPSFEAMIGTITPVQS